MLHEINYSGRTPELILYDDYCITRNSKGEPNSTTLFTNFYLTPVKIVMHLRKIFIFDKVFTTYLFTECRHLVVLPKSSIF